MEGSAYFLPLMSMNFHEHFYIYTYMDTRSHTLLLNLLLCTIIVL